MPDHQLNQEQKFRQWVEAQLSQIQQQRIAIDNMFQQIATLARMLKIKPEKFVKEGQNIKANYEFLAACMQEEQRLQSDAQAKAVAEAAEAKAVADKLAINQQSNAPSQEGQDSISA